MSPLSPDSKEVLSHPEALARLERLNAVLRAIRDVNQLIVRERDPARLLQETCEILIRDRGYDGALIRARTREREPPYAAAVGFRGSRTAVEAHLERAAWPLCSAMRRASDRGAGIPSPAEDCFATCPFHGQAWRIVVAALRTRGRDLGLLVALLPEGCEPDAEELDLAREVAGDLAFALHDIENERQRERYARIVEASSEGMALVDPSLCYLEASPAYLRLVGLPGEDIRRRRVAEVLGEEAFGQGIESRLRQCLSGEELHFEGQVSIPGPGARHLEVFYSPCRGPDGSVDAVAVCLRDLTEQRRSEQAYRLLFEEMLSGFALHEILLDEEGRPADYRFLSLNPAFERLTGLRAADVVGRRAREVLPGLEPEWIEAYGRVALTGEAAHFTREARDLGRTYEVTAFRTEPGRFACTFTDITEQARAWRSLEASEARYRLLADHVTDVIWTTTLEPRLTFVSPSQRRITGHTPEETLALPLDRLMTEDSFRRLRELLARALGEEAAGRPFTEAAPVEIEQIKKGGGTVWTEINATFLRDAEGRPTGVLGVTRDVSERVRLRSVAAQTDRLASMGLLAAGVAHEINNPLTAILCNLEEIARDPAAPDAPSGDRLRPRLVEALDAGRRIQGIVRSLGAFSRVEPERRVPVELRQSIASALSIAANEIRHRARIVHEFAHRAPVLGSEGRFCQIFLNLLLNAARAIPMGHADENLIRVRTWQEGETVCAEVSDTGVGIAPEHLERVFEPFFTMRPEGEGTGLGLSITRNLVLAHGGTIEARSRPGEGASFLIRFPAAPRVPAASEAPSTVRAQGAGRKGRLLVVDDEAPVRGAIRRTLRAHEVVEADSGEAARKLLEVDRGFDLILCDMMMPRVSGLDLHRWAREHVPELAARFVFVTGGAFTSEARGYLEREGVPCVEKPFETAMLRRFVDERLEAATEEP
jgi:PAS domain S-box-containing protein